MATQKEKGEQKMRFEDEVSQIFKSVFMREVGITSKAYLKIKEAVIYNLQDVIKQAIMRAIRREANLNTLEISDLLYGIEKRGQKYKLKVGKTMVASSGFGDFGERKYILNYEQEGEELENDNEK